MLELGRFQDRIVAIRELPARQAAYAPIPDGCHPALRAALEELGIAALYTHQREAFDASRAGENLVVTTGTASGKSLAYLLPVVQAVLEDPATRALLLFPTKALGHDQLRGLLGLTDRLSGVPRVEAGVYDGDTPPAERARLRERAHLILSNPDMLNSALLPAHGRQGYAHVFRNVRFLVIDELHTYRGAFGAHFANLMRRLLRVCKHHGSQPQILCSSATIANAREHAETLCDRPFRLIDRDGSPSAGKRIYFWQPPLGADETRKPVTQELTQLVPHLIEKRHRTITFCRSRKETEIVLKQSRERLGAVAGHDEGYLLAGYRGGYTPEERRKVERALASGELLGVVSTNALELGIDIGALEVVVQGGFPGTRASFWQQLGRAGRRRELAHAIVVLAVSPTDQYIAEHPDWLTGQPAEHAVLDRDNLAIQLAHVRAAAAELPLTVDDAVVFPDLGEIAGVLQGAGEVRDVLGSYHWAGGPFPAGDFSLRNLHKDRFKVVVRSDGRTLTEMDRPQVYREAHPRAIYLHDGVEYQVEKLDLVAHVASVAEVRQNFYTQPDVRTHIEVLLTQEQRQLGVTQAAFGDVRVDDAVVGYKMLEFGTHQNLGYEALHEHLRLALETEALWVAVPERVLAVLGAERLDALGGMVHALAACARLVTMAESSDLRGTSFHFCDEETGRTATALVCHDCHPGGLGFAAKAYEHLEKIVADAIALVSTCTCRRGCPACVGSYTRERALIAWALRSLRQAAEPPADLAVPLAPLAAPPPPRPQPARIAWGEVTARWPEVLAATAGDFGGELLARLPPPACHGERLVLRATTPGLKMWLDGPETLKRLRATLERALAAPAGWRLQVDIDAEAQERALGKTIKLRRRHDDLTGGAPATERQADATLAGGYLLRDRSEPG